ncbi:terminase small subunit [uncultured Citrobacter sp.]|uniref:terminase small subunit n=1 Tax=uncultured Citrobacter sp. TaxID=200446 RepID=UPI002594DD3F|nr:terminase small subunit [uncultured Citrobacter sp.]
MAKLTDKQELFAREYLKDLNATQAAIRAGYSEKTANEQASRLLANVNVQNFVAELKATRIEQTGIDAAYVLRRLVEIDQMDAADILDDEGGLLPISAWPKVWRTSLSGLDLNRLRMSGKNDEEDIETTIQKIKWPDKVKNLELLGKHVNVQAFKENIKTEISGAGGSPIVTTDMSPEEVAEKYKDLMG